MLGKVGRGLAAGLVICFAVRCVSRSVPEARFAESRGLHAATPKIDVPDADNFTFSAVGDLHVGNGDRLKRILEAASAAGDAFVILLGDITDQGDVPAVTLVKETLASYPLGAKMLPVIGNHDIFADGWNAYRDAFGPSHYATQIGNTKFITLDTADGTLGEEQGRWLEGELGTGNATNTILLSHYLPVIPGQRTYLKLANESEALRLMKLATDRRVRAWMGAHYHSYIQRNIEGVEYLVAGGGGGRRMDPIFDFFYVQGRVAGPSVTFKCIALPDGGGLRDCVRRKPGLP